MDSRDIDRIKHEAKTLRKRDGSMTYMQYLDQAARNLYGVRHFHEAQARYKRADIGSFVRTAEGSFISTAEGSFIGAAEGSVETTPAQYYLRSVQEYYLDF